jgi:Protein of unknown function (DUF3297)
MTDETDVPESDTPAIAAPEVVPEAGTAPDVPPDHLAINPRSPFFDGDKLRRGIGIRFKGTVRRNVEEYSISEGWVRVQAGKTTDRKGNPLTLKLSGPVEAWYEDLGEDAPVARL